MANYTITEDKSFEEINVEKLNNLEERVNSLEESINLQNSVIGGIYNIDGIEVVCVHNDPPLYVDRNHDLSYYVCGNDFVNSYESNNTISVINTYGYENGKRDSFTGFSEIGQGIINTNTLLSKEIESYTENWPTVWNKVNEFRQKHSNRWFVPTLYEWRLVCPYNETNTSSDLRKLLQNKSDFYVEYYLCSELNGGRSQFYSMYDGGGGLIDLDSHYVRTRLFCTI